MMGALLLAYSCSDDLDEPIRLAAGCRQLANTGEILRKIVEEINGWSTCNPHPPS